MSDVWAHTDETVCVHPGWQRLHGWASIAASFFAIFQGQPLQFVLTGERAEVAGEAAWVHVDENILSSEVGSTVAAINVFRRTPEGWRLVVHHGAPVSPTQE
jgi:ketosteroid isomerase-like protein